MSSPSTIDAPARPTAKTRSPGAPSPGSPSPGVRSPGLRPQAVRSPDKWWPQAGPQTAFVTSPAFEICYGGARGGGKTDAALGDFAWHAAEYGRAARGLMVRRTRAALEPTIERARTLFRPFGGQWREGKSRFEFACGAVLYFRHLDNDADADLYQGHDYSRVYVEELTQFPDPRPVDKLKATVRSAAGVPCGFRATCNPGGPGHNWVKARYVDLGARPQAVRRVDPLSGAESVLERVFIAARLTDNPALTRGDPDYAARLAQSGSAALVKAWLEGDWNVIEGAFFDKFSDRNIIPPFTIPAFWTRFRSFDWGYAAPFSVGWWVVASDPVRLADKRIVPRGSLIRYREWYGSNGRPGEGLRLEAEAVAAGILERDAGETIAWGVADPSIFAHHGGPTIGERMRRAGVAFRPADNTRVGAAGAMGGWDQMRARIAGTPMPGTDGAPTLYVFDHCRDFIRTLPALQHDPGRLEDLDTAAEDHIADETRYACLARPLTARPPQPPSYLADSVGWKAR